MSWVKAVAWWRGVPSGQGNPWSIHSPRSSCQVSAADPLEIRRREMRMRVSIGRTSRSKTISAPRRSGQLTPPCSVLLTGIGLLDAVGVLDAVGGGVDDVDADDWVRQSTLRLLALTVHRIFHQVVYLSLNNQFLLIRKF